MNITEQSARKLIKKYAKNKDHYERVLNHSIIVRDIALWCAQNAQDQDIDTELLEQACLVHDIASSVFMGEGFDYAFYQQHAILGAALLTDEGVDPRIAQIVKTHIHVAITGEELKKVKARLPYRSYEPASTEGRILNYADRFHSKDPKFVSFDTNLKKYSHLPSQVKKLHANAKLFGVPDLQPLSEKYGYPIT